MQHQELLDRTQTLLADLLRMWRKGLETDDLATCQLIERVSGVIQELTSTLTQHADSGTMMVPRLDPRVDKLEQLIMQRTLDGIHLSIQTGALPYPDPTLLSREILALLDADRQS